MGPSLDVTAWRRLTAMRLVLRVEREQGDLLPPWWFMLGRTDWLMDRQFYYPVPIALVVRLADRIRYFWNWLRSRPTATDRAIIHARIVAYARGYDAGLLAGERKGVEAERKRVAAVLERLGAETRKNREN